MKQQNKSGLLLCARSKTSDDGANERKMWRYLKVVMGDVLGAVMGSWPGLVSTAIVPVSVDSEDGSSTKQLLFTLAQLKAARANGRSSIAQSEAWGGFSGRAEQIVAGTGKESIGDATGNEKQFALDPLLGPDQAEAQVEEWDNAEDWFARRERGDAGKTTTAKGDEKKSRDNSRRKTAVEKKTLSKGSTGVLGEKSDFMFWKKKKRNSLWTRNEHLSLHKSQS